MADMIMALWIVVAILFAVFSAYYLLRVVKKPQLVYQDNAHNRELLARCQKLQRPYWVTPWMFNTHLQLLFLGLKKAFAPKLNYDRTDQLKASDGGTLAVEWLGADLPEETPTLVLLHTISGSAHSMRSFVRYIHKQLGWRVAVCIRRGHSGLPLTSARFNTMGCSDDFRLQLQHIETSFPQSPLFAVGISAGSGVLARYLGEAGEDTPLRAAVAYCPGYDLEIAFQRSHPFYSKMMAKKLARTFLVGQEQHFGHLPGYQKALRAENLQQLHDHIYQVAGYDSYEEYLLATNPVACFENISVPTMIINAKDDPVCHIDNALEKAEQIASMENLLLVMTERGSHCAYFEGLTAKSWANRSIADYLNYFYQQKRSGR